MNISEIMWTQQIVFRNISVYRNIHACTNNEKKAMTLKKSWEGYMGEFGGMRGQGEML